MKNTAVRINAVTRLFWHIHRRLYLATGGRIGARVLGWHVLLLRTVGRKTGQPRIVALNALADNGRYIVAASYAGESRHPAWFLNLRQNPQAEILQAGTWIPVHTVEAAGREWEALWETITRKDASYAEYQSRTSRKIPVVIIEVAPRPAGSGEASA